MKKTLLCIVCAAAALGLHAQKVGETVITKWQHDKRGAVSITYDDGTYNQFRVAVPIMNNLGLPGTFFINTGWLPGSIHKPKFVGRPVSEIVREAASVPTNSENLLERISASRFVLVKEADNWFSRARSRRDAGRIDEACAIMDEFFTKVRAGELAPGDPFAVAGDPNAIHGLTWDEARELTALGHECSSHMVTHPNLSGLDDANMRYELEMSRAEIIAQLDYRSSISAECPYGINEDRSIGYAIKTYPALRNRMSLDYMFEIHRGDRTDPVAPDREYVQWQRGIVSRTTLEEMNGWVDLAAGQQNMWLVTVIHGVDGIGWEPVTTADVEAHFSHIAANEDLWVATFGDAARYILERMNSTVEYRTSGNRIAVSVDHPLDKALFDLPLTLKTYVDPAWGEVRVVQDGAATTVSVLRDGSGAYVIYQADPGDGEVELWGI
jgi:peptidoglycan/xylan/chitin deacetylase (PgdA/CDA1 family)